MLTLSDVTAIRKYDGHIFVEGTDDKGKTISCVVYTEDVENLWFSIQRSIKKEELRTLREDSLERIRCGRLC